MSETEVDLSKTFRILIASDIHLGYNERHHERGIHLVQKQSKTAQSLVNRCLELWILSMLGGKVVTLRVHYDTHHTVVINWA